MMLNLVWFLWVVRKFEYKAVEHPSMRQAPAGTYKPQSTLPPWVQPKIVSGVQQANVSQFAALLTARSICHCEA